MNRKDIEYWFIIGVCIFLLITFVYLNVRLTFKLALYEKTISKLSEEYEQKIKINKTTIDSLLKENEKLNKKLKEKFEFDKEKVKSLESMYNEFKKRGF